ncbi:hypothetical protein LR48_Vigan205s007500 [Vigna angularis]|uniref:Uncharacterized protein n=1 Tax=Phaseolus angularis TaxID=3914 RepID=A0A0L9T5T8_PHAAN|nr:hypothetical protein LR48_Vigan205s007500 [Vigna angularis]
MKKHQAFLRIMARKKDLEKSSEGTSSPSKIVTQKAPLSHVNPALKLSENEKPSLVPAKPSSAGVPKDDTKRKLSRDKPVSFNKKRKITSPLLSGPLDPLVHVAKWLQYNLTPKEKIPFKWMSTGKALDMAYELNARASICMNYAAGSTKSLLSEELDIVRQELETSQKENAELSRCLEEALKAFEESREKAATALTQAQDDLRQLKRTNDDLKLNLHKATSQYQTLVKERDSLVFARDKLTAENLSLEDEIYNERLTGFEQGIAQCHYFFNTPHNRAGFDIMKVLVDGQLVTLSISEATNIEATAEAVPSTGLATTEGTLNVAFGVEITAT